MMIMMMMTMMMMMPLMAMLFLRGEEEGVQVNCSK